MLTGKPSIDRVAEWQTLHLEQRKTFAGVAHASSSLASVTNIDGANVGAAVFSRTAPIIGQPVSMAVLAQLVEHPSW